MRAPRMSTRQQFTAFGSLLALMLFASCTIAFGEETDGFVFASGVVPRPGQASPQQWVKVPSVSGNITFDDYPVNTVITNQYKSMGVVFDESFRELDNLADPAYLSGDNEDYPSPYGNGQNAAPITATFQSPVSFVSADPIYLDGGAIMLVDVYDKDDKLLGHSSGSGTIRIEAKGIKKAVFSFYLSGGIDDIAGIDNLKFDPGTDTDGDGLLDSWEKDGYDSDGDGKVDVDLPGMGANYRHKDIFVEVDWMVSDHNHKLTDAAKAKVVAAFKKAPVENPDNKPGINIHIDTGNMGGGNQLAHTDDLSPVWASFDAIKAANFVAAREPIFHYVIMGHQYDGGCSSGISRGIPASDFVVTLGCWPNKVGTTMEQAGTFMHELGHNLGLRHGGGDDVNYKPNFLSIMNYFFQMKGLYKNNKWGLLNYSQFTIKDLDETSLNEKNGLDAVGGDGALRGYGTRAYGPDGTVKDIARASKLIDWDRDGNKKESSVSVDINHDGSKNVLTGMKNDWSSIAYDGGLVGAGVGKTPLHDFYMAELTFEEYMRIESEAEIAK